MRRSRVIGYHITPQNPVNRENNSRSTTVSIALRLVQKKNARVSIAKCHREVVFMVENVAPRDCARDRQSVNIPCKNDKIVLGTCALARLVQCRSPHWFLSVKRRRFVSWRSHRVAYNPQSFRIIVARKHSGIPTNRSIRRIVSMFRSTPLTLTS
jgi:hypothetical protein